VGRIFTSRYGKRSPLPQVLAETEFFVANERFFPQDNRLEAIPTNLFKLPLLSILDVANNKLQTVPFALWTCTRLI
jgi:hypothetical protein